MKGAVIAPFVYFPPIGHWFYLQIAGCEIQVYAYRQPSFILMLIGHAKVIKNN